MPIFTLLAAIIAALLLTIFVRLRHSLHKYRITKNYTAAVSAPSVSVCIPARNETHAMTQCLERVLASDYAKLEVIVYDDGSVDDTSILIRSFAHAGVRFVPGNDLPQGWLGKNHALEVLAREASGTYVVFMDVDTFVRPTTISQLVGYAMTENVEMASVIPGRDDAWRASVLFGHLRYFWELILSRPKAPASSSSLWIMKRRTLLDTYGGFEGLKNNVAPEAALAAKLGPTAYHCLVSNRSLGVTYEKKWLSQVETARRLLYPMVGGTPLAGLLALGGLLLLNAPTFVVLSALAWGWSVVQDVALLLVVIGMAIYSLYTHRVWNRAWWLGGLLWPVIVLQELGLLMRSMWGYARHTITWKGRAVRAPVVALSQTKE